ncbi:MAG: DsbE family thiol:disulfide interchange protein [Woeseiaceae bacterium]
MNRYIVPAVAVVLLIPFLLIALDRDPSALPSPYIDKPAPEFDLPSLTRADTRVGTASYAGEAALINVWATWCVGCRQEHAFLMELSRRGTLPIYGINWRDNRGDALRWLQQYGDPYVDSAFDADGRVGIDWGVYGAPETFLLNSNGVVVHKHLGALDEAIWQREFVPLIDGEGAQ